MRLPEGFYIVDVTNRTMKYSCGTEEVSDMVKDFDAFRDLGIDLTGDYVYLHSWGAFSSVPIPVTQNHVLMERVIDIDTFQNEIPFIMWREAILRLMDKKEKEEESK